MVKTSKKKMIDVDDWDQLVITTYSRPYSFQQQCGCRDRGVEYFEVPSQFLEDYEEDIIPEKIDSYERGVSFASWLARDPQEWNGDPNDVDYLDMFWERNFYPSLYVLANDLYKKGLLPAGKYGINIDW